MIKKGVFERDLISGMQRELRKQAFGAPDLVKAGEYLYSALDIFQELGLQSRAEQLLEVMKKISDSTAASIIALAKAQKTKRPDPVHDPGLPHNFHMKNLTPQKMVENLKNYGVMFNMADDGETVDINNANFDPELAEALGGDDANSLDNLDVNHIFDSTSIDDNFGLQDITDSDDDILEVSDPIVLDDFEDEVSSK